MITIKELADSDFDAVKKLFVSVFTKEPWNDDWSDENQLNEYLKDVMMGRNPLNLGLYDDGELVGISLGFIKHWCNGTEYYIDELCIQPERQGQGLGTKFFELMKPVMETRGIVQYFLQTDETAPAYSFYKKLGFTELKGHVSFARNI